MREAWVNRGIWFFCYAAAAALTIVDGKLSYRFIHDAIRMASGGERHQIALALAFGIAVLASAIGGFLGTPWAWKFLHEVPTALAKIESLAERLALIFGHIIAAMFVAAVVVTIYALDLISTAYQINVPNIWARAALTGMIVFGGSGCLLFANIVKFQAFVSQKSAEDFELNVFGQRQHRK